MPMGIVSDSEFESELKDSSLSNNVVIEELNKKGRNGGDNNVPDSLRKIIGDTAITDGRPEAIELASHFGISPSSVSAYSNGSTSTKSYNNQPNLNHLNQVRERITRKARNRLIQSLDSITEDKLADAKPEILATVARSMSAIVKEMEPENPRDSIAKQAPIFVMYSPQFKKEEHFEHIFIQDDK